MGKYDRLIEKIAEYEFLAIAGVAEELKLKHPNLVPKIDFFIQRDPTRKYLHYEVKVLASGQALEHEIADVIELFHKYRDRLDKKDINAWNFTELRSKLFEIRDFGNKSKNQKKKELKENIKRVETQGAQKLYEDEQCELIYVPDKATACFYGQGTKWCITMTNATYFEDYQGNNVVFYYVLRKDLPQDDTKCKVAISVQRDSSNRIITNLNPSSGQGTDRPAISFWLADDTRTMLYGALGDVGAGDAILNIIKQDAPQRPMGFFAKLTFKPEELSFEDYAKNLNDSNKTVVAEKTKDPKVLAFLAKDADEYVRATVAENKSVPAPVAALLAKDQEGMVRLQVARNTNAPMEVLQLLAGDESGDVRHQVAGNVSTSQPILYMLMRDDNSYVRYSVAKNPNVSPEILSYLSKDEVARVRSVVALNPKTPVETLEYLANEYTPEVRRNVMDNPSFPNELLDKYFPNA